MKMAIYSLFNYQRLRISWEVIVSIARQLYNLLKSTYKINKKIFACNSSSDTCHLTRDGFLTQREVT